MLSTQRILSIQRLQQLLKYDFKAQAVATNNFIRYRKEYESSVKEFSTRLQDLEKANYRKQPKPVGSKFDHPFNSKHHPLNFSPVKTAEFFNDFVGPEQISPHYENFLVSRKYLMGFWGAFFLINAGISTVDLNWIFKGALLPVVFYMSYLYFYVEGRKSMMKPLLARFYRRSAANECHMFEAFYHENIENKIREMLRVTKSQLEYWNIHSNFKEIKAESVNNLLANEYLNLQEHIQGRAINILKTAKQYEDANKNKFLQQILNEAVLEVDALVNGKDKSKIIANSFDSALDGLSKGFMDYKNDVLLPLVLQKIKAKISTIAKLSEDEQTKLVALTKEQLDSIKAADHHARNEYLKKEPHGIDGSLKFHDTYKKIIQNWGKI